jgi:ABC-type dipeptide/oligopeptide/nickel transport system ATPase component
MPTLDSDSRQSSDMGASHVRVLVICGASGTGKTSTAFEIGRLLRGLGVQHALIDTDELDRVWPQPEPLEALIEISRRNLSTWWANFSDLGVRHLVLCGVMASVVQSERWIAEAIVPADITFVRLTATRDTREKRLRRREIGSGFEDEMRTSDNATAAADSHDPTGMLRVATDSKDVGLVAQQVLLAVNWIS